MIFVPGIAVGCHGDERYQLLVLRRKSCNAWNQSRPARRIKLLHKFPDVPVPYTTMCLFVTETCTFLLQNGALWDIGLMHCGVFEMGLVDATI